MLTYCLQVGTRYALLACKENLHQVLVNLTISKVFNSNLDLTGKGQRADMTGLSTFHLAKAFVRFRIARIPAGEIY